MNHKYDALFDIVPCYPTAPAGAHELINTFLQTNCVFHTFPSTVAAIGIASKQSLTAFHTFSPHSSPNLFTHSLHQHHKHLVSK